MRQYILVIWSGVASINIDCAKNLCNFYFYFFATSDLHLTKNKRCPAEGFMNLSCVPLHAAPTILQGWTKMFKCMYLDKYCHTLICIYTLYCNMFPIWEFPYCWHITINAPQCKKISIIGTVHSIHCQWQVPQRQRKSKRRTQCVIVSVRVAHRGARPFTLEWSQRAYGPDVIIQQSDGRGVVFATAGYFGCEPSHPI